MTLQELRDANRTKAPVVWRGRHDYETTIGSVTAVISRFSENVEVISAEVTSYSSPRNVVICRPEDIHPWSPINQNS